MAAGAFPHYLTGVGVCGGLLCKLSSTDPHLGLGLPLQHRAGCNFSVRNTCLPHANTLGFWGTALFFAIHQRALTAITLTKCEQGPYINHLLALKSNLINIP